jgi:hypothetical protein
MTDFLNHIMTFFQKNLWTLFSDFWFKKTLFRIGRHENKEKHLVYFSLRNSNSNSISINIVT